MEPNPGGSATEGSVGPEKIVEFLIEQERKLSEIDDQRQGAADGRTAVALTAALTLAGLSLTLGNEVADLSGGDRALVAFAAATAGVLSWLRAAAGYLHSGETWFSTHSKSTSDALDALRAREVKFVPAPPRADPEQSHAGRVAHESSSPTRTRSQSAAPSPTEHELVLAVWRNRAIDARQRAKRKERAAALAAFLLGAVLVVLAFVTAL